MPDTAQQRHINPWLIAASVMLSTFMEVLDTTVVNVSLPHIAGSLSASIDESTWVLTSYLVANAIILPITGWLSNYFGRKRLLMASVAGFTVSSFLCGIAPTLPLLILFRLIQGACGGSLQPLSQAVLLEAFPPEERGKAMGFWGLGIVVAPVLGPVLGGWLTDTYSWRWVFYINLPVGIAAMIMTQLFVFDPSYIKRATSRIDYWGIGMLAVWIGALQIVFDKGQEDDWFSSRLIVTLTAVTGVFLIAFLIRQLMAKTPVVDLRVFKLRSYSAGVFLMAVLGFVLYGSIVILPIWLQTLLGYSSAESGITMAPRGFGSMVGMPVVGILLLPRFDPRKLLGTGLLLGAFSTYQLAQLSLDVGFWNLFWPQFIQGFALGLVFVPLTTISMSPVPKESMGNATSLFNLMRNIGGSIGIAMVTTLSARYQQRHINVLTSHISALNPQAMQVMHGLQSNFQASGSDPVTAQKQAYVSMFGMVQQQAAMLSFLDVFMLLTFIFLAMVPLVFIMTKPRKAAPGEIAVH
ncbi:MAG: DHA2 family efflux MFS transporter permease subunit [Bryobacteraceae bacterium]